MATMTKEIFALTLKKLLKKKSLDKITVTELSQIAGVNRQTFYYNFQDIYDLLEWSVERKSKEVFGNNKEYHEWETWMKTVFEYFQDNKRIVLNVFQPLTRPVMERYMKKCFEPVIETIIRHYEEESKNENHIDEKNFKFIVKTYTLIIIGLIFEWIDHGMEESAEDYIKPYVKLLNGSYDFFIEKFV